MAPEPQISMRDAALRALLVARVNASRTRRRAAQRSAAVGHLPRVEPRRLQVLATAVVLVSVVAISAAAVLLGQSRFTAAGRDLTAPASATPGPTSADPSSSPDTTYVGPLIAPDGWKVVTRAQLHQYVVQTMTEDAANAAIWEQQAWLDMQCMADHGYLYDPISESDAKGLTVEQKKGYDTAFYGPHTTAPYDWRTAGCHGRSVHLTGQDDAN